MSAHNLISDIVVVGSTPGGIACAIRAAREGARVLLTNYHDKPGGMCTGGLGGWETLCDGDVRSPIYTEIRLAILAYYRDTYGEDSQQYRDARHRHHGNGRFEPIIGQRFFMEWIEREPNIRLLTPYYPLSASASGSRITDATFRHMDKAEETVTVHASIFCDCTYEGDFLAAAGVPFRLGREARSEFGERFAGRVYVLNKPPQEPPDPRVHEIHSRLNVRHVGAAQQLLSVPGDGKADHLVQAINYRTILSADPANRVLPHRPENYDPSEFASLEYRSRVAPIPNNKVSWNRPQLVGLQNEYLEGDWPARRRVLERHWRATTGLLYYLQNDAPLSEEDRADWRKYGFARDEGIDNDHPPCEIYVREGRRLEGRTFLTEHDVRLAEGLERTPLHRDSIAFGDWYLDCHACTTEQREGSMHEGKMMPHWETFPCQVPYGSILSRTLENVMAPVCMAASHVAFGAIRLEVGWMNISESAGFAAAMAVHQGVSPASLDVDTLLRRLATAGVSLAFFNDAGLVPDEPWFGPIQYLSTKGFFPTFDARPHDPLDDATARAWLEALASSARPDFDPNIAARRVLQAEQNLSAPLDRNSWNALLHDSGRSATPHASLSPTLTRAEACMDLFHPLVSTQ